MEYDGNQDRTRPLTRHAEPGRIQPAMTFLPIVERELRVAARLTGTYKRRVLAAAVVAVVTIAMLLVGALSDTPSHIGSSMFGTLSYLMLAFCLLEGVRKTADCLSEERREGTLGLLFLTDLKGYDVILGKLAATSLPSVYGLFAMLPMLGLSLLLGGVTQGEFWRRSLALINVLFFSLSAGIWVSARNRVERRAMGGTMLLLFLCLAGPLLAKGTSFRHFSPAFAFFNALELRYRMEATGYWQSILSTQILSWTLLVWAAFTVADFGEDEGGAAGWLGWRERWRRWEFGDTRMRVELRREMLALNPAYWLAGRSMGRLFLWISMAVVTLGYAMVPFIMNWSSYLPALVFFPLVINYFVKVFMAWQACHCLAEARANNAMEMLLSTPLSGERILEGQVLALQRTFLKPVVTLLMIEAFGGYAVLAYLSTSGSGDMAGAVIGVLVVGAFLAGVFGLDIMAVTWVGMWFGLSAKNETQAVFKTVLYVLIIPLFFGIFYCFGIPFLIAWPIVCTVLAREKLRSQFRRLATQRFSGTQEAPGWWPFQTSVPARPRIGDKML